MEDKSINDINNALNSLQKDEEQIEPEEEAESPEENEEPIEPEEEAEIQEENEEETKQMLAENIDREIEKINQLLKKYEELENEIKELSEPFDVDMEQGLYMLMTVLKGPLAVKQSKALIRTFKKMKDYILENRDLIGQREILQLSMETANNRIPKNRPLTGRNVRKVGGLFLYPFSKKEVNQNGKTEKP